MGGCLVVAATASATRLAGQTSAEEDSYRYGEESVPITIHLDSIGLESRSGAARADVEDLLARFGVRLERVVRGSHYVGSLPQEASRSELVSLARDITTEGQELIYRAGLSTRVDGWSGEVFISDYFIVQFRPDVARSAIDALNAAQGVDVVREPRLVPNNFVLQVTDRSTTDAIGMSHVYDDSSLTEFAQPDFMFLAQPLAVPPPDPHLSRQWHLNNDGTLVGTADSDIDAVEAWTIERGSADVIIAVMEVFGFDTTHADLRGNLWLNAIEAAGMPMQDEAADPLLKPDDVRGWDFEGCPVGGAACGTEDVTNGGVDKVQEAHATATAGLAAAEGDNGIGVSGVCPECTLLPIESTGGSERTAAALEYAYAMGAAVINSSYHVLPKDNQIRTHIQAAGELGRGGLGSVVVWSACYPFSFSCPIFCESGQIQTLDSVLTVTQTSPRDEAVFYSNGAVRPIHGDCIDLSAPGQQMATTDDADAHGYNTEHPRSGCSDAAATPLDYTFCYGGTSAAAPVVSGVAGLVISKNPNLTAAQVMEILRRTADTIDTGNTDVDGQWVDTDMDGVIDFSRWYGHGRVNAYAALEATPDPVLACEGAEPCLDDPCSDPLVPCAARHSRWEFGARAGLTLIRGPDDRTVVGGPGGGPGAKPVFHATWFPSIGPWMLEGQFGFSTSSSTSADERNVVVALQPAYQWGAGPSPYVGVNLAYEFEDDGTVSQSDVAAGFAVGVRFFPRPFLALRIEASYRRWVDRKLDEYGLGAGFGVLLN